MGRYHIATGTVPKAPRIKKERKPPVKKESTIISTTNHLHLVKGDISIPIYPTNVNIESRVNTLAYAGSNPTFEIAMTFNLTHRQYEQFIRGHFSGYGEPIPLENFSFQ